MSDLDRLFYWRGIAPDFYSFDGHLTPVPLENRIKILEAMGVDTSTDESIALAAYDLDTKPWLNWLPPLEVLPANHSVVEINFHPDELENTFRWCICDDKADIKRGEFVPANCVEVGDYTHEGARYSRRALLIHDLQPGYYEIQLQHGEKKESTVLAKLPHTSYIPEWVDRNEAKPWGFVIQLYTLRSKSNWGIGDFSDLEYLITHAASYGVDIIGLNPFHTLQTDLDHNVSPYSPSDRRFLNPLYIDVERVPGFLNEYVSLDAIQRLRKDPNVQYSSVRELKFGVLYSCFTDYALKHQRNELAAFIERSGAPLVDFVNYESQFNWVHSGLPVATVGGDTMLQALRSSENALEDVLVMPLYYAYLQLLADIQLEACQQRAEAQGMKIGLVRDLAVGASGGGSEVKTNGHLFCDDAAIGAPPDPLALTGQNWGIPPMDPAELRKTGFRHFIDLLRKNMAHCGALRIDHAMSLFRLWWCPPGASADKGAYIYYPFRELLGLLCLESYLNRCVIIAEDLGIVPEEFRHAAGQARLFSNRVFYFEKWNDREFKHPSHYEQHALAMLDNHDVPTIVSWWNGTDLELKSRLNLLGEGAQLDQLYQHRLHEKEHLLALMRNDGLLAPSWLKKSASEPATSALIHSIIRYASRTNSTFFVLQLEDLLMMDAPVNVPGTFLEHANWCRKLTKNLEDIFQSKKVDALLRSIPSYRNPQ